MDGHYIDFFRISPKVILNKPVIDSIYLNLQFRGNRHEFKC